MRGTGDAGDYFPGGNNFPGISPIELTSVPTNVQAAMGGYTKQGSFSGTSGQNNWFGNGSYTGGTGGPGAGSTGGGGGAGPQGSGGIGGKDAAVPTGNGGSANSNTGAGGGGGCGGASVANTNGGAGGSGYLYVIWNA